MFSVFRTLSVRYVSRRWVRAALIVASISLGVATLVATQALNQTMSQAAVASANPLAGVADLIVSNDELPLARDLVREIARAPFVDSARPFLTGKVTLPDVKDGPNEREILVLGLDLIAEMTQPKGLGGDISLLPDTATVKLEFLAWGFTEYTAVIGRHLATDLKILVDGKLNREHAKLRVVNRAAIRVDRAEPNEHAVRVVGAMDAQGESRALAGPVMVLDLSAAAAVLDLPTDRVHRIDVLLKPGTNIEEARDELRKVLAGRALVRTVAEQNESVLAVMRGMQTGFSLCGLAALVVGMFLVYNSMAVTVAERRHEIGVLLALGATRAQVWRLFAAEAALLGLAGSLLGIPLGIGLANVGLGPMQSVLQDLFYTVEAREVHVSRTLLAVALIVGILTSVAAALVPAFQASQEAPAEAVRRVAKAPSTRRLVVQASVSAVAVLVGLTLILLRDEFPHRLGTYGGLAIIMIGGFLSTPFLSALIARALRPPIRAALGVEWRLAADNIIRSPGRTGLVIGALAAGVALVVQTAGVIHSNQIAINDWVEESIGADIIVSAGGLVSSSGTSRPMDPGLAERMKEIAEVEDALPVRMLKVPFKETRVTVMAVEAQRAQELELKRLGTGRTRYYQHLRPGAVIASENFIAMHGLKVGDDIVLPGPPAKDGSGKRQEGVTLRIAGSVEDYTWNHGTLIIDRDEYRRHWQDDTADVFDVYLRATASAGVDEAALEALRQQVKEKIGAKLGASFDLRSMTRRELQEYIRKMIEQVYGIAYGQQVVVMIVAALGVVTALLISVLQRRREMGLLRAIGASRRQVVRSVLSEACLMGVIGTAIGLLVGIPLQWYVIKVIILDESGFLFPVYIPWKEAFFIALGSTLTATLAGLGPALYAVRQRIPDAIAYE
ncbi:MAG: FtsX-like permease family protein [Gemmataceae bacterium]